MTAEQAAVLLEILVRIDESLAMIADSLARDAGWTMFESPTERGKVGFV